MLGFGFNKTKLLASAEKNAKQGRLQNAIADYERILKEEPNDLNVLNTIGDLHARVGNIEQATAYFQRVGDAYASEGFTVKAIAMYKKLTKQNPNASAVVLKLAELYAQQGLNNDARVQYTAVAELHTRNGDAEAAASVFQKILDLDPDNPQMQGRLAEIYGRLGKNVEARDVYFRSAQTLRARGALDACDDALGRVLKLDPTFSQAVLLRGQVKLDSNDPKGAVKCLESLPDLDSRPEALRVLLRAHLKLSQRAEAEPAARKLLTIFNDTSGVTAYGEWLMAAGDFEAALQCYEEYATQLLTVNAAGLIGALHKIIGPLKASSRALETLSALFQKAGDTTHVAEVTELLAHASVQDGALGKARDLYQKLADMEPENPLHLQNYNQILSRIEADSGAPPPTPEEGEQALMVDELDDIGSTIEQKYSEELGVALQNAFTDAELFESYNLPVRAIPPLEAMLPRAPRDLQLNRRLGLLYVRAGRFAEAAQRCRVLESVYGQAGHQKEADEFKELAARYAAQAAPEGSAAEAGAALQGNAESADSGKSFLDWALPASPEVAERAATPPEAAVVPVPAPEAAAPSTDALAHEIDLSDEWERVLAEQSGAAPAEKAPAVPDVEFPAADDAPSLSSVMDAALSDLVEEAGFYLSQSMLEEARVALARAEALSPKAPAVRELRAQVEGMSRTGDHLEIPEIEIIHASETSTPVDAGAPASVLPLDPGLLEVFGDAVPAEPLPPLVEEAAGEAPEPLPVETEEAAIPVPSGELEEVDAASPLPVEEAAVTPAEPATEDLLTDLVAALSLPPEMAMPQSERELEPPMAIESLDAPAPAETTEAPLELEDEILQPEPSGPESGVAAESAVEADESAPLAEQPVVSGKTKSQGGLSDFVLDLENSLGSDFALTPAPPSAVHASAPPPAAIPVDEVHPQSAAIPSVPAEVPAASPVSASAGAACDDGNATSGALAGLFAEFKQEVESATGENDDPETHYNLGVAFKEMGLLDEAIGELQKVCKAIEQGHSFHQVIEAYTWLADCFVQNGMPEAGVHWYEKALQAPGLDNEGVVAIHYELACAHEAAGDVAAARRHFMRVLSNNIDYRDVAERIKNLKS
jgi:tetratricopeptide (TPR) repeat protein